MSFVLGQPCELSWIIRVDDLRVETGSIKWDYIIDPTSFVGDESEDADEHLIQVVTCSKGWEQLALPVFINEMILADDPLSTSDVFSSVPAYEQASFAITAPTTIWWGLRGCGFGSYYLRTIGGFPHLDNECMNKGTIMKVFKEIVLPTTA